MSSGCSSTTGTTPRIAGRSLRSASSSGGSWRPTSGVRSTRGCASATERPATSPSSGGAASATRLRHREVRAHRNDLDQRVQNRKCTLRGPSFHSFPKHSRHRKGRKVRWPCFFQFRGGFPVIFLKTAQKEVPPTKRWATHEVPWAPVTVPSLQKARRRSWVVTSPR